MFASLESFSLFFFVSLALIVLLIVFEDEITAHVEKQAKHTKKKTKIKEVGRYENRGAAQSKKGLQEKM